MHINFDIYEKTRFVIIAMLALRPLNEDQEREAIFAALDNNHKIEVTNTMNNINYRITYMNI